MASRQHVVPSLRIFDGADCLDQLPRELARLGSRRAAIFCGSTLAQGGSPLEQVERVLGGALAGIFTGVKAHSPLPTVEAGAALLRETKADAVIAVGGGSAIVTARAASILVAEGRSIQDLATSRNADGKLHSPKLLAPKLPQLICPTTPTTAMAKAGTAVLDPATRSRLALFDPKTRAGSLFFHPDLLGSAPRQLLVDASLNTFCSAAEGLLSKGGDPMSDALLMHAVQLYARHLDGSGALDQPEVRLDLAYAATMSGCGTDYTAGGITTALGHAIAAHCGIEGGQAKIILLPHTIAFNAEAAKAGLGKLSTSLSADDHAGEDGKGIGAVITRMTRSLGIPARLRDVSVDRGAFAAIAKKALGDWFLKGNPRPVTRPAELTQLLEQAW